MSLSLTEVVMAESCCTDF